MKLKNRCICIIEGIPGAIVQGYTLTIVQNIAVYLGIPFILGILLRLPFVLFKGTRWYHAKLVPILNPLSIMGLIVTILILLSSMEKWVIQSPWDIVKITLLLTVYYVLMFFMTINWGKKKQVSYQKTMTVAINATSHNYTLVMAIAIVIFGINVPIALASVIGLLIEVPMMVLLITLGLRFKKRWITIEMTH